MRARSRAIATPSRGRIAAFALLFAAAAPGALALTLHNQLGDDQRRETLTVRIDDGAPLTITVDADTPEAAIDLPVTARQHRYTITGEAVDDDGKTVAIAGGGLIVTKARLDEIAESPVTAADALAAYRALVAEIGRVAPPERYALLVPGEPVKATPPDVIAAERRLGVKLPADYVRFVTAVGALRFDRGPYLAAEVFAPAKVEPLVEVMAREHAENGSDAKDVAAARERAVERFPRSARDLVLDLFSSDEPTVFVPSMRCPANEVALAFPASDYQLLAIDPGDNPFLALIDYEDDILGETQCLDYDRLFAYSLHDHLVDLGDEVLYLRDADEAGITVRRAVEGDGRIWLALASYAPGDDEDDDDANDTGTNKANKHEGDDDE